MDKVEISQIKKTPLKIIDNENGNIYHALKKNELEFNGFGEIYFSKINFKSIKAWKKHISMTMNLIVPYGEVKFVFYDSFGNFREEIIGEKNYFRLTVPPGFWFGFKGIYEPYSIVTNISNIEHDPYEAERLNLNQLNYKWNDKAK